MDEAEFDKFAAEYRAMHAANIKLSGEDPEYFAEYKVIDLAAELARSARASAARPEILDFGAGIGYSVPFFRKHLPQARVTCLDVSRKSLDIGAATHGQFAEFKHFDGATIPCDANAFDVALASCVFHHIPHAEHLALLGEIRRVLKPGGLLLVFEHNPLNPLTRHAVNTCEFDEHAELILAPRMRRRAQAAGFAAADVRYRIFFPHFLRGLRPMEPALAWLPLGAQYYVRARK
ncbi:MAG TPA: class I SAM-dependent methyltransferase [Gammaproteobacteria bacterium]|nr:class I SAM-dependent methyltransferase [Gammaproteobacteria bacterium]